MIELDCGPCMCLDGLTLPSHHPSVGVVRAQGSGKGLKPQAVPGDAAAAADWACRSGWRLEDRYLGKKSDFGSEWQT